MRTGHRKNKYLKRKDPGKKQKGIEISPEALEGAKVESIGASIRVIPPGGDQSITVVKNTGRVCGPSGERFNDVGIRAVIDCVTQAGFEVCTRQ